ncbi:hypothetical protein Droror1_Dr00020375 [Drosera rotundifolia]
MNSYESAEKINAIVVPEFIVQGLVCVVFSICGRWIMFLLSLPLACYHLSLIFVATWNVTGKSPPGHLNLEDWLHTSPPVDIYVLGFQEIVPLNAGNVLGTKDNGPAKKWLALIRRTLNNLPGASGTYGYHTPS